MKDVGIKLEISPLIIESFGSGKEKLWSAVHDDGSANRVNGDVVYAASSYALDFGLIAAGAMWIRKKFRNKGKTKEDLAAEKEAAKINSVSRSLEILLREYFRAAREGSIDEVTLDALIGRLAEMQEYEQSGKLKVLDENAMEEIRRSIAEYTAAITGGAESHSTRTAEVQGTGVLSMIREQLIRQRDLISIMEPTEIL